jgi:hypothetical protein
MKKFKRLLQKNEKTQGIGPNGADAVVVSVGFSKK